MRRGTVTSGYCRRSSSANCCSRVGALPSAPRSCITSQTLARARADRGQKRRHRRRRVVAALRRLVPAASLKQRVDETGEAAWRADLADAGLRGHLSSCDGMFPVHRSLDGSRSREKIISRALALARQQHERRVRLVHAGQVEQVVFLAERPVDVAGPARRLARERDERRRRVRSLWRAPRAAPDIRPAAIAARCAGACSARQGIDAARTAIENRTGVMITFRNVRP